MGNLCRLDAHLVAGDVPWELMTQHHDVRHHGAGCHELNCGDARLHADRVVAGFSQQLLEAGTLSWVAEGRNHQRAAVLPQLRQAATQG